jgi:hypothetical protein
MSACLVFGIEASMPPSGPGSAYAENLTFSNETNATNTGSPYLDFFIGNNTTNETIPGSANAAILSMTGNELGTVASKSLEDSNIKNVSQGTVIGNVYTQGNQSH